MATAPTKKTSLDKDLKKIAALEEAAHAPSTRQALLLGFFFLLLVLPFTAVVAGPSPGLFFIMAAGVIGGYMALNIGANDVANNVGPAVGANALTMIGALAIAAVFEAAGALIAGAEVVNTISSGIINVSVVGEPAVFVRAMLAALLAAALWLNLATYIGAPVSTTHSIVGGVMGVGIAAAGMSAVQWPVMGAIAASWVISPLLGGVVAALFLLFIEVAVINKEDRIAAARRWVPVLVGIMAGAFTAYLMAKGVKHLIKTPPSAWAAAGVLAFVVFALLTRKMVDRSAATLENSRKGVARLFRIPLIVSAALLSFAHGANDVANAVGPLAAIVSAVGAMESGGGLSEAVGIPWWVLLVGAAGISVGLVLFGPKLIVTVGEKITKLDPSRAFCVALSAAVTVIVASQLGLPVSSTHIAVGGIFGVGFLRELMEHRRRKDSGHAVEGQPDLRSPKAETGVSHEEAVDFDAYASERMLRKVEKSQRRKLVRRQYLSTIVAAWIITVPLAAALAAGLFFAMEIFF
ncbi:inorganic phosphate transporter [Novispirillum sp. DQ9]|uniref:inorganic phosphate transporter n=1 Tax=Novispirillum sp. DQ9 TaxID=3398612 RepID=UPI003C7ABB1B